MENGYKPCHIVDGQQRITTFVILLSEIVEFVRGLEENKDKSDKEITLGYETIEKIVGEKAEKAFIKLFSAILSMRNILSSFDQFKERDIIAPRDLQDYQSIYLDLYDKYRGGEKGEKENIIDDVVFEIELIKQVEINIDYILYLVEKYHDSHCEDKEILASIMKAVDSSLKLRSKKKLIEDFIHQVNVDTNVKDDWRTFVIEQEEKDLKAIIDEEKLKPEETRKFIDNSYREGEIKTFGTDIVKIMPPTPLFGKKAGDNAGKKQRVIGKIKSILRKILRSRCFQNA